MNLSRYLFVFTLALITSSCSWVDLTKEGEKVRVLSVQEVSSCKELGKTTVSLLDRVAGIDRNREQVQSELETLARNSAADMQGDTVVPTSEIEDGKQVFAIYRCVGIVENKTR
ncbi:MAG: DUF4156 domain-containing protein [Gammaproteobacteria bacterium]|nr:DUF4156 domain-containing protein [Gammaproteobacteria bacterium]